MYLHGFVETRKQSFLVEKAYLHVTYISSDHLSFSMPDDEKLPLGDSLEDPFAERIDALKEKEPGLYSALERRFHDETVKGGLGSLIRAEIEEALHNKTQEKRSRSWRWAKKGLKYSATLCTLGYLAYILPPVWHRVGQDYTHLEAQETGVACKAPPAPGESITVLFGNMAHARGVTSDDQAHASLSCLLSPHTSRRLCQELDLNARASKSVEYHALDGIVEEIKALDPAPRIVMFQEDPKESSTTYGEDAGLYIAKKTDMCFRLFGTEWDYDHPLVLREKSGNSILLDFDYLQGENVALPRPLFQGMIAGGRAYEWVEPDLGDGQKLIIYNLHLDPLNRKLREEQIGLIERDTASRIREGYHVLLAGDFNSQPNSEVNEILNKRDLFQTYWKVGTEPASLVDGSKNIDRLYTDHGTTINWCKRIDRKVSDHYLFACNITLGDSTKKDSEKK